MAAAGWCSYSGLVATKPDAELDLKEIEGLLGRVVKEIASAKNRVRYTMNGFVISVCGCVKPLSKQAKAAAQKIGTVSVDMGGTGMRGAIAHGDDRDDGSAREDWSEKEDDSVLSAARG